MNIKKLKNTILSAAALLRSSVIPLQAETTADILFVVDESGSMAGEHAWIGSMVTALDSALIGAGVTGNRYGLVGYGKSGLGIDGRKLAVGGGDFGTAAELSTASGTLVTSGSTEDGYAGIDVALNDYALRAGAAVNVILITDENRDILSGSTNTYASILSLLQSKNALLNAVVDVNFSSDTTSNALGIDGTDAYFEAAAGTYTSETGSNSADAPNSRNNGSIADYVNLALASGGAAWDLKNLCAGGNTADAFTAAFVDIKVAEIIVQPPAEVPVPAAAFLFAPALLGFLGLRRKAKNSLA